MEIYTQNIIVAVREKTRLKYRGKSSTELC